MLARITIAVIAMALAVASPIGAEHCSTWTTSQPEIDLSEEIGWYVDNDLCQPQCLFSIWPYPEANGIPGLQRGDEVVDDTCHGMIEADVYLGL